MTVTAPNALPPGGGWGAAGGAEAGPTLAVRRALAVGAGRLALRIAVPGPPHRRRAARLILQDAARADGAQVLEHAAAAELLLLGASAEGAVRAEEELAEALVGAPSPLGTPAIAARWRLPQDAAPLLEWAEASAAAPPGPAIGLGELDRLLAVLPLDPGGGIMARRAVLRLAAGRPPAHGLRRLVLSRRALAAALGPLGLDPDLLDHAADSLLRRRLATLAPEPPCAVPPLIPLPAVDDGHAPPPSPPPSPAPGAIGVLPLATLAMPGAATRRERLAAAGWTLGFDGLDAAALRLLLPTALPEGTLLLLRWSASLADDRRAVLAALRPLDPARLVLTGCDGPAAFAWGFGLGIALFAGPAIEALRSGSGADGAGGGPGP